jgi:tRNA threonylcarbamoyladenosine biosynthesis protein TsaB
VNVLAIETATSVCAAAIVSDGKVLSEAFLDEKYVHAEKLMMQIDEVLTKSGRLLNQLDCIAVSIGPGSFTGLRIGLGVAKGLVYAIGMPIVPVPTLRALAMRAVDEHVAVNGDVILSALDARRDEVYRCYFDVVGQGVIEKDTARDSSLTEVIGSFPGGRVVVTGDAKNKIGKALQGSGARAEVQPVFVPDGVASCTAGSVGRIGEILMRMGKTADVSTLEPMYIKEFFFPQQSS